uniref:Apoptosis regulator BAX n=1 Tax=Salvator merianae TaxID=96440 RepID=A0A8D0BF65_SALMN
MAAAGGPGKDGTTSDQILQTGTVLLKGFIRDRVQRSGDSDHIVAVMEELTDAEVCDPDTKRLSECLRRIGDELDGNTELQRMIEQVQMYPPKDVFFRVAAEMFSDGTFNWGRVVALFYFACKLVLKAICTKLPELIKTTINWTMEFIQEHVLSWIQAQGGWVSFTDSPRPRTSPKWEKSSFKLLESIQNLGQNSSTRGTAVFPLKE